MSHQPCAPSGRRRAGLGLAVAALLAAGPARSQPAPSTAPPATTPPVAAQPAPPDAGQASLRGALGQDKAARIENHIARLHATLRITATQEPLWLAFAGTMRRNVMEMQDAYGRRQADRGHRTAVQDLESYGELESTNARDVQLLLPPFRALYDSFSPEQRKAADAAFQRYTDKAVRKPV